MKDEKLYAYSTAWQGGPAFGLSLGFCAAHSKEEAIGKAVTTGAKNNPNKQMLDQLVLEINLPIFADFAKAEAALDDMCRLVGLDPEKTAFDTAVAAIKAKLNDPAAPSSIQ